MNQKECNIDGDDSELNPNHSNNRENHISNNNGHIYSGGGKVVGLSLQSGTRLRLQHLSAATGLIATYLIEIGVQIFLIFHCWRSLVMLVSSWDWSLFLILSSTLTSLLVTTMSMVWVCRGLDFVGRVCARLLCYVLHFCLLGLVWRYLKLAFAYDHADVQEFVALRIFQVYIQSLPLTSIHLAWLITFREEWFGLAFWMIIIEIVSVGTALTISTYIKSDTCSSRNNTFNQIQTKNIKKKTTQIFSDKLKCLMIEGSESVMWGQVLIIELNILSRMMLLVCRLLILGILLAHLKIWTNILILIIHFIITFVWIICMEKSGKMQIVLDEEIGGTEMNGTTTTTTTTTTTIPYYSRKEFLLYILKCSYIIFWDITSTLQGPMKLSSWALPTFLVIFENGALMIFYSYKSPNTDLLIVLICTGCLIIGFGLFFILNFMHCNTKLFYVINCCDNIDMKSSRFSSHSDSSFCKKNDDDGGTITTTPVPPPSSNSQNDDEDFCCNNYNNDEDEDEDDDNDDENCCWKDVKLNKQQQEQCNNDIDKTIKSSSDLKIISNSKKIIMTNSTRKSSSSSSNRRSSSSNNNSQHLRSSWDINLKKLALEKEKPLIMANNYTNISEVLMTARVKTNVGNENQTCEKRRKNLMKGMNGPPDVLVRRASSPTVGLNEDSPPVIPMGTTTWVPDTCCNDSNGSSNSRNTNTLLEPNDGRNKEGEDDMILDNPHFVFYFPEQKTHRHHSVVRKLNIQSINEQMITTTTTKGKVNGSSPTPPATDRIRKSKSRSNSNSARVSPATSFNFGGSNKTVVRISTPVEIKKAARVIMNYPKHQHHRVSGDSGRNGTRCHCQQRETIPEIVDPTSDPFYEKLMEDPYGILICEGEPSSGTHTRRVLPKNEELFHQIYRRDKSVKLLPSIFHVNQKLKVLCAKCLQNHDPLLSNCLEDDEMIPSRLEPRALAPRVPPIPTVIRNPATPPIDTSVTTEYPSETEMTWTAAGDDQLSVSSHLSTATYTTWPRKAPHLSMSMWTKTTNPYPKEFTSREYVRTWLLTSQARAKHYYNEYGQGNVLKKVHRSRTISAGVGGSIVRSIPHNNSRIGNHHHHHHHHTHGHKTLGKRHGPIGRGQSPESMEALSILPSLFLTPPPKQKQHPVLPHSLKLDDCFEISTRHQHQHQQQHQHKRPFRHERLNTKNQSRSKAFYKDLEIIV